MQHRYFIGMGERSDKILATFTSLSRSQALEAQIFIEKKLVCAHNLVSMSHQLFGTQIFIEKKLVCTLSLEPMAGIRLKLILMMLLR